MAILFGCWMRKMRFEHKELNFPGVLAGRSQPNFNAIFRHQFQETFAPLDQYNRLTIENFIESQRCYLRGPIQAVQIDVIDAGAVFVDQREGRAGRRRVRAQTCHETFDELGFAAAELAGQREDVACFHIAGELTTERFGLVRAIGNEGSHEAEVEKLSC